MKQSYPLSTQGKCASAKDNIFSFVKFSVKESAKKGRLMMAAVFVLSLMLVSGIANAQVPAPLNNSFELDGAVITAPTNPTDWTIDGTSITDGTGATSTTNARTGSYCYKWNTSTNALSYETFISTGTVTATKSSSATPYLHLIYWALASNTSNVVYSAIYNSSNYGVSTATAISNTAYTQYNYSYKNTASSSKAFQVYIADESATNGTATSLYLDDIVLYADGNAAADLAAPGVSTGFTNGTVNYTSAGFTWTNGTDALTGVQGAVILRTTNLTAAAPTLNAQGLYSSTGSTSGPKTDVSGNWTIINNATTASNGSAGSYTDNTVTAGQTYKYAIITYDMAYNYSTALVSGNIAVPVPPTPTTTSISPTSATAGGAQFTLTVNGTNFVSGGASVVTWNGTNLTTTFVNTGQLTATVPAANIASAGTATIGVTVTGAAASANTQTFTINAVPIPTTTSISPTSATAGGAQFTLTVNGTNFISGQSTVTWNGTNLTTAFVSSTQLTATVPATNIASSGTATVGVTTIGAASASNTQTFTINAAATPTTTSIAPTSAIAGGAQFTLTVNGTNFISGQSTVTWNGTNLTTTFVSSTQLTATVPASDITTVGTATVGVTTTGAVASSNTQTFSIVVQTWTGNSGTDWNTPGNWNTNTVPTASSKITIANVSNPPVISAAETNMVCNTITFNSGATLTVNGGLTVSGSTWTDNSTGGATVSGTGTVTLSGTTIIGGTNSAATFPNLVVTGTVSQGINVSTSGTFNLSGTSYIVTPGSTSYSLTVNNTASVNPAFSQSGSGTFYLKGGSAGTAAGATVTVTGNLSSTGGVIYFDDGAAGTTGTVLLQVNGNVSISGSTSDAVNWNLSGNSGTLYPITFGMTGNFSWTNSSDPYTSGSGSINGFTMNGAGTTTSPQTINYAGAASSYGLTFTVNTGTVAQLLSNIALGATNAPYNGFTVNGTLDAQTFVVSGGNSGSTLGEFVLNSGATLISKSPTGVLGNITASSALSGAANYTFDGAAGQVTSAFTTTPANTVNNLTIATAGAITNSQAETVTGVLKLTSGILTTTATNKLTLTNVANTAINSGSATSFINGPVTWTLGTASSGTYTVPVGVSTTYLPMAFVAGSNTGSPTITITPNAAAPVTGGADGTTLSSLSTTEYWKLVTTTGFSATSFTLARSGTLGSLDAIGKSTTNTASSYSSIGGTVSSPAIGTYNGVTATSNLTGANASVYLSLAQLGASKLVVTTEPSSTVIEAGSFTQSPVVYIEDANGNLVTNNTSVVTATVGTGTGPLTGTLTATASGGIATFTSALKAPTTAQTGLKLTFTSGSLTSAVDNTSITVYPGAISKLIWSPSAISSATVGTSVSGSVTSITAEDANNNICSSGPNVFSGSVTFAGTAGATGTSAGFTNGVLNTFPALTPTTAGSGKTITATSGAAVGTLTLTTVNKATPTITTPPTAGTITYGQALSASTLSGGSASVGGTFAFTNPSTVPNAGTTTQSVTFTPSDAADYNTVVLNVNVTVNQATPTLSITGSPTSFTYTGSAQGPTVTVTNNSGGTKTYSYTSTDGGGYSASTPPTDAGAYQVTVSVGATANYTAAGPSNAVAFTIGAATPTLSITGSPTSFTYSGSAQGPTVTVTNNSGGAQTFSYTSTDGGGYSTTTPPTDAGAYQVTVSVGATANYTAAGPSNAVAFTIGAATPTLSITGSPTSFTYTGSAQGPTVTVTNNSGGAQTFSYTSTDGGGYSTTTPPTDAGAYQVTVSVGATANYTAAGPSNAVAFTIGAATPTLSITGSPTSFTYSGSAQGPTVTVTNNSGGAQTFSYTSTDGGGYSTTTPPTDAGAYQVTVSVGATANYTAAGPSNAIAFTIGAATPTLSITGSPTSFTYTGSAQGPTVTVTNNSGGAQTFSYTSTDGGGYSSTTPPTDAGAYQVTVSVGATANYTAAGPSNAVAFTIGQATTTISVTGATVYTYNGTSQGPASVSETGSTGAVSYSYSGTGGTVYGPSAGLPTNAGTYTATATVSGDANYAGATSLPYSFTVNPAPLTITANSAVKCNGASEIFAGTEFTSGGLFGTDGVSSVTLTSAGSDPSAAAGNYDIVASGAVGSGLSNYTISYVNGALTVEGVLTITMTQTNPDCNGEVGSLSGVVAGGYSPYTYKLNTGWTYDPSGTFGSTALFSPVAAGKYTYSAEDAYGCLAVSTGIWVNPLTKTAITVGTGAGGSNQICYGGTVTVSTTGFGGTAPYLYSLNGGSYVSSSSRYFNVGAGTYTITVKDNANPACSYTTDPVTVTQPSAALTMSVSETDANCTSTTGTITASGAGGYGTYSYSIDNGSTFQSAGSYTGVVPGTYTVLVKDVHGCTVTKSVTVKQNTLTTSAIGGNVQACYGSTTTLSTTPSGGTSPYTYSLDGGSFVSSSQRYFAVPVGTGSHYITVKDALGCTATTAPVTVTQPSSAVSFTSSVGNANCTSATGTITITASGGYGSYSYSDNNGGAYQVGNSFAGLTPGSYNLIVKDVNGCVAAGAATVKQNTLTTSAVVGSTQICYGATTSIYTVPSGGVSPYTYSLDGGSYVGNANKNFAVSAGSHSITVMDNAGCTATASITVTQPSAGVTFTTVSAGQACTGNGIVSVTASGGYGNYSYSDDGGNTYESASSYFTGLSYGSYTVKVKDMNGCASGTSAVKLAALTSGSIQGNTSICAGGSTTIYIVASGGASPYTYSLDNAPYVPSASRYFNVTAGTHTISVKDNGGCTYAPAAITVNTVACKEVDPQTGESKMPVATDVFKVNVYPNPTLQEFHLQLQTSSKEDVEMVIMNMLGEKVYETKGTFDQTFKFGSNFVSGIYILEIKQGKTFHTLKLIKGN